MSHLFVIFSWLGLLLVFVGGQRTETVPSTRGHATVWSGPQEERVRRDSNHPSRVYDGWVTVPDLVGLTPGAANARLEAMGLRLGEISYREQDGQAGTVVSQDPSAGNQVLLRSTVRITLCRSRDRVKVPHLVGKSLEEARRELEQLRLLAEPVQEISDGGPMGTVVKQDPLPDSVVLVGSRVALTAVSQPSPVIVPDLTGKELNEASENLAAAGLRLGRTTPPNVGIGRITDQYPPKGSQVRAGTGVDVTLETVAVSMIPVPDLNSLPLTKAILLLRSVGLTNGRVGIQRSDHPSGTIIAQWPNPRTLVPPGSVVELTVAQSETGWPSYVSTLLWGSLVILTGVVSYRFGRYRRTKVTPQTDATAPCPPGFQVVPISDFGVSQVQLQDRPFGSFPQIQLEMVEDPGQVRMIVPPPLKKQEDVQSS